MKSNKTTFIYPFFDKKAQGKELLHSIRSICKNFQGEYEIIIIGNKPDYLTDEIKVITGEFDKGTQPAVNVAQKLEAVINDRSVPNNFVWMNDDIYFVNPITLEDIQMKKHLGAYNNQVNFNGTDYYHRSGKKTFNWLEENTTNRPLLIYSTHTPYFWSKWNWRKLFKILPLTTEAFQLTNLYHNFFVDPKEAVKINIKSGKIAVGLYRTLKPSEKGLLISSISNAKIFNHSQSGYCSTVIEVLNEMFAEKCIFEK